MALYFNIRYLILSGPESEGHLTGESLKALFANGIDEKKQIIGTEAQHPVLYNLPTSFIERFLKQVSLIDLQFEGDPEVIRKAVWSCYQEKQVDFHTYSLFDPGAYPEPPLSGKITWRVSQPWTEPEDEDERAAFKKAKMLIEHLKSKVRRNLG